MKITYRYWRNMYVTCVDGRAEEAYADLAEWLESLTDFPERYRRSLAW